MDSSDISDLSRSSSSDSSTSLFSSLINKFENDFHGLVLGLVKASTGPCKKIKGLSKVWHICRDIREGESFQRSFCSNGSKIMKGIKYPFQFRNLKINSHRFCTECIMTVHCITGEHKNLVFWGESWRELYNKKKSKRSKRLNLKTPSETSEISDSSFLSKITKPIKSKKRKKSRDYSRKISRKKRKKNKISDNQDIKQPIMSLDFLLKDDISENFHVPSPNNRSEDDTSDLLLGDNVKKRVLTMTSDKYTSTTLPFRMSSLDKKEAVIKNYITPTTFGEYAPELVTGKFDNYIYNYLLRIKFSESPMILCEQCGIYSKPSDICATWNNRFGIVHIHKECMFNFTRYELCLIPMTSPTRYTHTFDDIRRIARVVCKLY